MDTHLLECGLLRQPYRNAGVAPIRQSDSQGGGHHDVPQLVPPVRRVGTLLPEYPLDTPSPRRYPRMVLGKKRRVRTIRHAHCHRRVQNVSKQL